MIPSAEMVRRAAAGIPPWVFFKRGVDSPASECIDRPGSPVPLNLNFPPACPLSRFCGGATNTPLALSSTFAPGKTEILQLAQSLLSVRKMPCDISKVRICRETCSCACGSDIHTEKGQYWW